MNALFYPFHLCHERTLHSLLADYETVHFRDFMALRLTPLMGTTAFPDRMSDDYPKLFKAGRIVQGHDVSGPLNAEMIDAVNRDLSNTSWRSFFHEALLSNYRFQRGLFDTSQIPQPGNPASDDHSILTKLSPTDWMETPYDVETVQALSRSAHAPKDGPRFDYGWALIKTSASLVYTIQLCQTLHLTAVTDSSAHYQLLAATCQRDGIDLTNSCLKWERY